MRSASCGVVIEPSTSERSYGPRTTAREASTKVRDLDLAGDGQQLVLAIEQRELAAVARGEFPHGELRFALRFHSSLIPASAATRS